MFSLEKTVMAPCLNGTGAAEFVARSSAAYDDQLVVLPVGIGQTKACDPLGMEVVDEVADLFAQESQQSVLSEILGLTRGEVVWMQEGNVSPAISPTPSQTVSHLFTAVHMEPSSTRERRGATDSGTGRLYSHIVVTY